MHRLIAALSAALPLIASAAQDTTHPHAPAAVTASPERRAAASIATPAYRSPFADYRPYSEALEPRDWRRANEEVHETGGHIGLMKKLSAQPAGHGMHGAPGAHGGSPVPPAGERK